ncbi:MAG: alpha-mannosidase, partial [Candidatus Hydrogenedentes bacterium]|nr:alpha-mannosidase [Candidatus Hydrogenedentota bacterium]
RVGFNPDSFGHAGTFPQIFKKSGIDYYVYMRPDWGEMRYTDGTTFWWQANDGSEILACCLQENYVARNDALDRIKRLPHNPHLNPGQTEIIGFFGVGNHGGGPTKVAIKQILDAQKDTGLANVKFSTLLEYFEGFQKKTKKTAIPRITTDLQHHARGCYSVHSEVKRLNRQGEHVLMAAERFATIAWLLQGHPYPQAALEHSWKHVLYNQFHDILAGTSIEESYNDTRDQMGAAKHAARHILNESIQTIARTIDTSDEGNTIVVVNPLPWPVKTVVNPGGMVGRELTHPYHIADEKGKPIPSQAADGDRIGHTTKLFTAEVPALGYRCFSAKSGAKTVKVAKTLLGGRDFLDNEWWRIEFDPSTGQMLRLYDKKNKVETLTKGNVLACMVDSSDTWSHGYDEFRNEAGRFGSASLELLELGDIRATMRIVSTFDKSTIDQTVSVYRDVDTIDCKFRINWQQKYTMLKLGYETTITEGTATYDTAYGSQVRNTQGFEEPGQKWFDLTGTANGKTYGFGVLNDSKYGFDVRDGIMRVTMLRSPAYAHHDRGRYDSSKPWSIIDQGWQTVHIQLVPHKGGWEAANVAKKSWELNEPVIVHVESGHKGALPANASFLNATAANVLLTVLKKSEDGKDLIIRGYETAGKTGAAKVQLPHWKKSLDVTFAPHEIKTIRINTKTWKIRETNLLEE